MKIYNKIALGLSFIAMSGCYVQSSNSPSSDWKKITKQKEQIEEPFSVSLATDVIAKKNDKTGKLELIHNGMIMVQIPMAAVSDLESIKDYHFFDLDIIDNKVEMALLNGATAILTAGRYGKTVEIFFEDTSIASFSIGRKWKALAKKEDSKTLLRIGPLSSFEPISPASSPSDDISSDTLLSPDQILSNKLIKKHNKKKLKEEEKHKKSKNQFEKFSVKSQKTQVGNANNNPGTSLSPGQIYDCKKLLDKHEEITKKMSKILSMNNEDPEATRVY